MVRTAILFDHFGPYHFARVVAAARYLNVIAIETASSSDEYSWIRREDSLVFPLTTLFRKEESSSQHRSTSAWRRALRDRLFQALNHEKPDVVAVPGWSDKLALLGADWAIRNQVPIVVMSESQHSDQRRRRFSEWVKRRYVRSVRAALAGGQRHAEYLNRLGMHSNQVFLGYDVVDNSFFATNAGETHTDDAPVKVLGAPYFLASARFIAKKNLPRLINAYAGYRTAAIANDGFGFSSPELNKGRAKENPNALAADASGNYGTLLKLEGGNCGQLHGSRSDSRDESGNLCSSIWNLVLLGDGPLHQQLVQQTLDLGVSPHVHFMGFQQYKSLPFYYRSASAFIQASTTEQWGLVVNEAMASGLPVLVSNACGCALDLVQENVNGWTFNPRDEQKLTELMVHVSSLPENQRVAMGAASRSIIEDWGPDRFANGIKQASECAIRLGPNQTSVIDRILLAALIQQ